MFIISSFSDVRYLAYGISFTPTLFHIDRNNTYLINVIEQCDDIYVPFSYTSLVKQHHTLVFFYILLIDFVHNFIICHLTSLELQNRIYIILTC